MNPQKNITEKNRFRLCLFALIALAAIVGGKCYLAFPHEALWFPDTKEYVNGNIWRNPGYFLFLKGLSSLSFEYYDIILFQLILGLASVILFCWSAARLFSSKWLCVALGLLLIPNSNLLTYHLMIHCYSLYSSLILLHFTFLIISAPRSSKWAILIVSLSAAAAFMVRPNGCILFGNLVLFAILQRELSWNSRFLLFAPYFCVLLAWSLFNYSRYSTFSILIRSGSVLSANYAPLIGEGMQSEHQELVDAFAQLNQQMQKEDTLEDSLWQRERNKHKRYSQMIYSRRTKKLLFDYVKKNFQKLCPQFADTPSKTDLPICADRVSRDIFIDTLLSKPLPFLKSVIESMSVYFLGTHSAVCIPGCNNKACPTKGQWQKKTKQLIPEMRWIEPGNAKKLDCLESPLNYWHSLQNISIGGVLLRFTLSCFSSALILASFLFSLVKLSKFPKGSFRPDSQELVVICLTWSIVLHNLAMSVAHIAMKKYLQAFEPIVLLLVLILIGFAVKRVLCFRKDTEAS